MAEYGDMDEEKSRNAAMLGYVLLLVAPILPVTPLIGVIIAYVYRDDAPSWLQGHFQLQIRTFWIGFLFLFLSMITLLILVGKLLLLVTLIWWLVRLIKGVKYLSNNQPYPNPVSWGF